MTVYQVQWGRGEPVTVASVEELDAVLDEVAGMTGDGNAPFAVSITEDEDGADPFGPVGLQVGFGHPSRGFVFWTGDEEGGYGREPGIGPHREGIGFDLGGQWTEYHPDETRVTPETARQAARHYVETGQRPTGIDWS